MKKPELLATAADMNELERVLLAGADAVSIGGKPYGLRNAGDLSLAEMGQTIALAHEKGAKAYISVNMLLHNHVLDELPSYLRELHRFGADAFVFGDPAVVMAAREAAPGIPLHWSMDMISTNYQTANYWGKKGATRAFLARELNLDEILEAKEHSDVEIQVQIHGIMCIFHSRRDLVSGYFADQGKIPGYERAPKERGLFIREEKRRDQKYPIYEDENGTHIMSAEDICMIDSLPEFIDAGIDSLKIEGLLKSPAYNELVVSLYRKAIDTYVADPEAYEAEKMDWLKRIEEVQPPGRPLTSGFYFKEQVY